MELLRNPVMSTPQEMPGRPGSACSDVCWDLVCECLDADVDARPTFRQVATRLCSAEDVVGDGRLTRWLLHGE